MRKYRINNLGFLTNSLEIKLNDDFTYISDFDVPSSLMPSVAE